MYEVHFLVTNISVTVSDSSAVVCVETEVLLVLNP